jgi:drug/metabolite transporter (DMT)-like permease
MRLIVPAGCRTPSHAATVFSAQRRYTLTPFLYTAREVAASGSGRHWFEWLLAWYFVSVWGSGFLATKVGLQHAAPFTFLTLRFLFGLACLIPVVLLTRPRFPSSRAELVHVVVAGLLMHAVHLGGSHYTQYLGMSAGITALLLAVQPLITAMIAARWLNEPLSARQWLGILIGLGGVTLVVWHKMDVREATLGSLLAVTVALAGVTAGTLYQRAFCPLVDLRSSSLIQFAATLLVIAPLSVAVEDMQVRWSFGLIAAIVFLVIGASMLAVSALHLLMRRGQAARVTSLIYLTPVFAVVLEWLMFDVMPSPLSVVGIAATCCGVALAVWRPMGPPGAAA